MNCPKCNAEIQKEPQDDGGAVYRCPDCGWGSERLHGRAEDPRDVNRGTLVVSRSTWIKLPIFWLLSLLIVFGPLAAICLGLPLGAERAGWDFVDVTPEELAANLTPGYWIAMLVYVLVAGNVRMGVDTENLGLFGTWMDNPFSYEDDANRFMLRLAVVLYPGKIVWFTVAGTAKLMWLLLRGRSSGDA